MCDWCQGTGESSPWQNPIGTRVHFNNNAGVSLDFSDFTINVTAPTDTKRLFEFLKATWPGFDFDLVSPRNFGPWALDAGHHFILKGEWYENNKKEFAFRADLSDYPKNGRIEHWIFKDGDPNYSQVIDLGLLDNHTHLSILPNDGSKWTVKYGLHVRNCDEIEAICGVKKFKFQG